MSVEARPLSPHDADAERAVLSGLMHDANSVFEAAFEAGLVANDFFVFAHRVVYAAALERWTGNRPCGPLDLYRDVERRGELAELGPRPGVWLAELWCLSPWPAVMPELRDYPACGLAALAAAEAIDEVVRFSEARDVIHAALEAIAEARDGVRGPERRTRPRLAMVG